MTAPTPAGEREQTAESCNVCRYVRPARSDNDKLVCRRYAPRSEWRTGAKLLSVPIVLPDDWCGEYDPRTPPLPSRRT